MYSCIATAQSWSVCDRRARYRPRRHKQASDPRSTQSKTQTPPQQPEQPEQPTQPTQPFIDSRAQAYDASARWRRITELNVRLSETLDDEGRAIWLALEEALHVHWLDVAVDHYNRGYAAGRAQGWVDDGLADATSAHDKLRAIAHSLIEIVDAIKTPRTTS